MASGAVMIMGLLVASSQPGIQVGPCSPSPTEGISPLWENPSTLRI